MVLRSKLQIKHMFLSSPKTKQQKICWAFKIKLPHCMCVLFMV